MSSNEGHQLKAAMLEEMEYLKQNKTCELVEPPGVSTPSDCNQVIDDFVDSECAKYPYREAVGCLMYLSVATRPDISFALGVASCYMESPKTAHVIAVKRIFKYLKQTCQLGIRFSPAQDVELHGFCDADYAGDRETRRSTSGYVFLFGGSVISWSSERQKSVALSTTESEYIAAANAVKELVWLKSLVQELTMKEIPTTLFMDNQSAIRLIKNP